MVIQSGPADPVGSFAVGFDRRAGRLLKPGPAARIAARIRARALDRALLRGADLGASSQLAARAAQLAGDPIRHQLADALDRVLRTARKGRSPARVTPSSRAVLTNEPELRELAALLRGSTPVYAQGVAMLHALLTDGTGPVYTDPDGAALASRLHEARAAVAQA